MLLDMVQQTRIIPLIDRVDRCSTHTINSTQVHCRVVHGMMYVRESPGYSRSEAPAGDVDELTQIKSPPNVSVSSVHSLRSF